VIKDLSQEGLEDRLDLKASVHPADEALPAGGPTANTRVCCYGGSY
jgi:hypothetical protein